MRVVHLGPLSFDSVIYGGTVIMEFPYGVDSYTVTAPGADKRVTAAAGQDKKH
jgi:hypothetical protein